MVPARTPCMACVAERTFFDSSDEALRDSFSKPCPCSGCTRRVEDAKNYGNLAQLAISLRSQQQAQTSGGSGDGGSSDPGKHTFRKGSGPQYVDGVYHVDPSGQVFPQRTHYAQSKLIREDLRQEIDGLGDLQKIRQLLEKDPSYTFRSGTYTERVIHEPLTLVRVWSNPDYEIGSYLTTLAPSGSLQATIDLALSSKFNNAPLHFNVYKAPIGTTILCGIAAPHQSLAGEDLIGGAEQVFVGKDDVRSWNPVLSGSFTDSKFSIERLQKTIDEINSKDTL